MHVVLAVLTVAALLIGYGDLQAPQGSRAVAEGTILWLSALPMGVGAWVLWRMA